MDALANLACDRALAEHGSVTDHMRDTMGEVLLKRAAEQLAERREERRRMTQREVALRSVRPPRRRPSL